jgi:hypothetical protein
MARTAATVTAGNVVWAVPLRWATLATLALGFAGCCGFLLFPDGDLWHGLALGSAKARVEYGEPSQWQSSIRQPWNTWSNLAYAWVGFLAVGCAWQDRKAGRGSDNGLAAFPQFSLLMGLSCLYLALGSLFFHASLTRLGQRLDVAATYASVTALLGFGLFRLVPASAERRRWLVPIVVGTLVADFLLFWFKWQISIWHWFPGLIASLAVVIGAYHVRTRPRPPGVRRVLLALALLLLALAARQLDVGWTRHHGPGSLFRFGHPLWHALTAAGLAALYLYCRTGPARSRADQEHP